MRALIASGCLLLSGCVEEPTTKEAEAAAAAIDQTEAQDDVKQRQLSIEQAADEAVKLIEAEAKAETDAAAVEAEAEKE